MPTSDGARFASQRLRDATDTCRPIASGADGILCFQAGLLESIVARERCPAPAKAPRQPRRGRANAPGVQEFLPMGGTGLEPVTSCL